MISTRKPWTKCSELILIFYLGLPLRVALVSLLEMKISISPMKTETLRSLYGTPCVHTTTYNHTTLSCVDAVLSQLLKIVLCITYSPVYGFVSPRCSPKFLTDI